MRYSHQQPGPNPRNGNTRNSTLRVCLAACSLIFPALACADHADHGSDLPAWAINKITPAHRIVSSWVENSSRNIDGFFGSDEFLKVENHSYLRLSQEFSWEETEDPDGQFGVRFKLHVPTTTERLKVIIESDPEESLGTLEQQGINHSKRDLGDTNSSVIGLEGSSKRDKSESWANRVSGGVKFHIPLDPYVRLTSERLWSFQESPWSLESNNRFSWFNSDGYSARTRWDFGRAIDSERNLRFITQFQWQEDNDKLEFSQRAEINRTINPRSAIRYAAVVIGESAHKPRIEDTYLQVVFRRNIHHKILFADIAPSLHFPREDHLDPRWAITLRLEMFFRGDIVVDH